MKIKQAWFRLCLALAAITLTVGSLAGCGASDSDCQGDKGRVTAKDYDPSYTTGRGSNKVTHSADYDLTILRADGTTYDNWYKVGSTFPHPSKCEDGKAVG